MTGLSDPSPWTSSWYNPETASIHTDASVLSWFFFPNSLKLEFINLNIISGPGSQLCLP